MNVQNNYKNNSINIVDHTKQAALMLMAGHTPKSKLMAAKRTLSKSPTFVVKKPSPAARKSSGARSTKSASRTPATPARGSSRGSPRGSARHSVSISITSWPHT
jgi:hypothetical protein